MGSSELDEPKITNDESSKLFKLQPINKFRDMGKLRNYEIIRKLGQGTFGVVQKARNIKTKELVALKQLLNHSAKEGFPITAMREITILKKLNHKNILKIIDMIYEEPKTTSPQDLIHQRGCFYTVSPYMCSDLVGLLENPNVKLEVPHIKCFMIQLLKGIQYIHEQMFLHRDIKAANILIDDKGVLKIADFGLARVYHGQTPKINCGPGGGERAYTGLVVTRWYRPPELLLGERRYTTSVDIWGIGCVFGELFTHKPILVGKSDAHQAQIIFGLVGPPNSIHWPQATGLPNKSDLNIGLTCQRTLETRFEKLMGRDGVDLLSGLLTLDPYKRLNALDALDHEYFKNEPLPMESYELPKFEECHEIDKERFKLQKELKLTNIDVQRIPKNQFPTGPSDFSNNPSNYHRHKSGLSSLPKQPKFYSQNDRDTHKNQKTDSFVPRAPNSQVNGATENGDTTISGRSTDRKNSETSITSYQSLRERSPRRINHKPRNPAIPTGNANATTTRPNNNITPAANIKPQPNKASSTNIFMTNTRKQRPKSQTPLRKISDQFKRRKILNEDQNESDLTDFDEDIKDSNQFDSFLDWDTFTRSPENRKLQHEKKQFETKHN